MLQGKGMENRLGTEVTESEWKKFRALKEYLQELGSIAVAFSGGVDSAFLMKAAHDALGDRAVAITAKSESFPGRELEESRVFCRKEGIRQIVVESSELDIPGFAENPPNRCYLCKKEIFGDILKIAEELGIKEVAEGSNMDDNGDYRPGLQAIRELGIKSPLRQAGLYKQEIRDLSRALGLPTWNKPSFACLASRFVYGEIITRKKLGMVEQAEEYLKGLGLKQLRVRMHGDDLARIEIMPEQFGLFMKHREEAAKKMQEIGFAYAALDLTGYRTGSMNETLDKESALEFKEAADGYAQAEKREMSGKAEI